MNSQITITKRYSWDMGHRLPNHEGKCARLHGHTYVAEIDITGPLDNDGMVVDFYLIKDAIKELFGDWDHRTMLYEDDSLLRDSVQDYGIIRVPFMPTAECIAIEIMTRMRTTFNVTRVRVYETPDGWAEVRS